MNTEKCPICEKGIMTKKVTDEVFFYRGFSIRIPNYIIYECSICEESIVDNETLERSGLMLDSFKYVVDTYWEK